MLKSGEEALGKEALGKEGKDKVTGFTGTVTGYAEYLYGCGQYCLVPKAKDGNEIKDGHWFDKGRIEIIGEGVSPSEVQAEKPGGPQRDAPVAR